MNQSQNSDKSSLVFCSDCVHYRPRRSLCQAQKTVRATPTRKEITWGDPNEINKRNDCSQHTLPTKTQEFMGDLPRDIVMGGVLLAWLIVFALVVFVVTRIGG